MSFTDFKLQGKQSRRIMSVVTTGDVVLDKHENINNSTKIRHRRFGHDSDAAVEHMIRRRNYGTRVKDKVNNQTCETLF